MDKAEQIFNKVAKLHKEQAGGTVVGGITGLMGGMSIIKGLEHGKVMLTKPVKATILAPMIAGGAIAGKAVGDLIDKTFNKKAEESATYPISRAHVTSFNILGSTIPGRLWRRAAQGRKNIGQKGITESESKLLKGIKFQNA